MLYNNWESDSAKQETRVDNHITCPVQHRKGNCLYELPFLRYKEIKRNESLPSAHAFNAFSHGICSAHLFIIMDSHILINIYI